MYVCMYVRHQTFQGTFSLPSPSQSLEEDVNALKDKLSAAQDCGKNVTAACSEEDEQAVDGELQELAGKWNDLNTDVYTRKHHLEDALLQLGGWGGDGSLHTRSGGGGSLHTRSGESGSLHTRSGGGGSLHTRSGGGGSLHTRSGGDGSLHTRSGGGGSLHTRSGGGGSLHTRSGGGGSLHTRSGESGSLHTGSGEGEGHGHSMWRKGRAGVGANLGESK